MSERIIRYAGDDPRAWGRAHGEAFAGEIRSLAAIRSHLTQRIGGFPDHVSVVEAARLHLPVLEAFDVDLHAELVGIAEGAGVTAEDVVILNHYTDLRDLPPDGPWLDARTGVVLEPEPRADAAAAADAGDADGGCSILYDRRAAIVAQTWDMHATAMPYIAWLEVPARAGAPAAVLLSLTGCMGMAGMNEAGVAVAINNLTSIDARVGVVWSALVRRALRERTAEAARDVLLASPVGSGHHYLVADEHRAFGIETSGTARKLIYRGEPPVYAHTNHCLDAEVADRSRVPPTSTTRDRLAWLEASLTAAGVRDAGDAWARLGSVDGYPRSICTNMATPENPHGTATCAGVVMELRARRVLGAGGFTHGVEPRQWNL